MAGFRNTKKNRYYAIFASAASVLARGQRAIIRPEGEHDYRTIMNYWYDWRRITYGMGSKSADPEIRRISATVLDSTIKIDSDQHGRIVLAITPNITPQLQHTIEEVLRSAEPTPGAVAFSTGSGQSAPAAGADEARHWEHHTKPWQDFFESLGPMDILVECLDMIPRERRGNPDLASISDLPLPSSAEGKAWQKRFTEYAQARGPAAG